MYNRYFIPQDSDRALRITDTEKYKYTGGSITNSSITPGAVDYRAFDSDDDPDGSDEDSSDEIDRTAAAAASAPGGAGRNILSNYSNRNHYKQHLFQSDDSFRNVGHYIYSIVSHLDRVYMKAKATSNATNVVTDAHYYSANCHYVMYSERKLISFVPGSSNLKDGGVVGNAGSTGSGSGTGTGAGAGATPPPPNSFERRKAEDEVSKPFLFETSEVKYNLPLMILCGGEFHVLQQTIHANKKTAAVHLTGKDSVAVKGAAAGLKPWEDEIPPPGALLKSNQGAIAANGAATDRSECVDITPSLLAGFLQAGLSLASNPSDICTAVAKALGQFDASGAAAGAGAGAKRQGAPSLSSAGISIPSSTKQLLRDEEHVIVMIDGFCQFHTDVHTATLLLLTRLSLQEIFLVDMLNQTRTYDVKEPTGEGDGKRERTSTATEVLRRVVDLLLCE